MSSEPISLNGREVYDIGGKLITLHEIQDAVIKASMYDDLVDFVKGGK